MKKPESVLLLALVALVLILLTPFASTPLADVTGITPTPPEPTLLPPFVPWAYCPFVARGVVR